MVRKDYEKLFTHFTPPEPPVGLFDRILLAIKREQELRQTKKIALSFFVLLIVSLSAAPFSTTFLAEQTSNSGILYFTSTAFSDLGSFVAVWQEFALAIAESLPITSLMLFAINMIVAVFTLRLFLYKKRLLVGYLLHGV